MESIFTLHVAPDGDVLEAARDCERDTFVRVYNESRETWDAGYTAYEASTFFLAVTEPGGDVVASMRVIRPNPGGLKTFAEMAKSPWFVDGIRSARSVGIDPAYTWDVATLAMRPGVRRSSMVPLALYHGLFHAGRRNDARWIVMIIDSRVRRILNMLSIRTQALPGTIAMPYDGSASSIPLWGDLPAMADHQRRVAPEAHRLVNLGIGLDGIRLPNQNDYDLDRVRRERAAVQLAAASAAPGSVR